MFLPKVYTAVTTEPITKTELKRHLKMYDDGYSDTTTPTIKPITAGASTTTGSSIDVLGASASIYVNIGTVESGGKLNVTVQHSDNGSSWSTFESFTEISASGTYSKVYTGGKQYVRAVAVITVANVTFGVDVSSLAGDPTDDTELDAIITRARQDGEMMCRQAFAPQTLDYGLDSFPAVNYIELPMPPLTSVTSIDVYDSTGAKTTLTASTDYLVDTDSTPGRIVLPYSKSWPSGADYPINPIRIRYVCGYTTLPQQLKSIMLYHCGLMMRYRDSAIPKEEMDRLQAMYNFHRMKWFGGE